MRPVRDCRVPGCGPHPIKGRDLCSRHYYRERAYGDALRAPSRQAPTCKVEDCQGVTCAKGYCQMHYLRAKKHGDPSMGARFYGNGRCHADGCERSAPRGRYCRMHQARMERYGKTELPPRADRHMHTGGYVNVRRPDHPVARKDGWAMEHRVVLYDAIGPGAHACRWCGQEVCWTTGALTKDSLVVDHLDDDKANNDRSNLAPACTSCNSARSSYWGRLAVVIDEGERRTA